MHCTLKADTPGAFMYHCAGDKIFGIWEHIANGMYGGIVVHPQSRNTSKRVLHGFWRNLPQHNLTTPGTTQRSFDLDKT